MTAGFGNSQTLDTRFKPSDLSPRCRRAAHSYHPATMSADLQDPSSAAYKKAKRLHLKTTKNRPDHADADWTPFRAAEKKYKSRFPPPDLAQVLDIAAGDLSREQEVDHGGWRGRPDAIHRTLLNSVDDTGKKIYMIPALPGRKRIACVPFLTSQCLYSQVW